MPSTYAHDSFAKRVMDTLPGPLSDLCRNYQTQFLFGSQGPDFFYFYRPSQKNNYTEIGSLIHSCTLNRFLRQVMPILTLYGTDSMEYAYTLGFICHYALDGKCHQYIIPQAKSMKFPHAAMETEFDRFLMEKDEKDPLSYPLHQLIPNDGQTIDCLHHIYPDIPENVILSCLNTYRRYRKLWLTPTKTKYKIARSYLKTKRRSGYFCNFLMKEEPNPLAQNTNPVLYDLYTQALAHGVPYIQSFHDSFTKGLPLDARFEHNFKTDPTAV